MTPADHESLDTLREHAREAALRGNGMRARDLFSSLLEQSSGDAEALNYLAMSDLATGHADTARARLRQSLEANAGDPTTRKNLGVVLLHDGDLEGARELFAGLVADDPTFFVARLHLGLVHERLGQRERAANEYFRAIVTAQQHGQWTSPRTTAPGLRRAVEHAMEVARGGRRALIASMMEPLQRQFGPEAMARVGQCVAGYLGDLKFAPSDPRQRPQFLYFPGLPETPVFAPDLFPWYADLEGAIDAITAELHGVLADAPQLEPFLGEPPPGLESSYLAGSKNTGAPQWDAFFFHRHGRRYEANASRCPRTMKALDRVPIVRIPGHAPESLFSVLGPGSHIKPHHGVTNTRAVTHLPVVVPRDCRLRVADHLHVWVPGCCFTFDDTFEHEAWNHSDKTRVVLLFDVWNPHLTIPEQKALTALVQGLGELDRTTLA
ncbi:aspartyl/asparaginyl beta-hydroxylase domain-containing protein [Lysobacter sp. GX 14042]|uniref:aspartyl/asparaginyl beta-hydroxylase domain-containing protein n=1 Tax=Lysobacter sp. GX 14042 TaxID=2907155 RepID=UPI001F37DA2E|nr:aspartyl/asparaginyl beta-hydroxylase domain-containing protein [Lysobacter sp. GX 14042]MCE7031905.1 aspartyl/asparaginyl beta-hydroxylase domain-containing protein [Lysobacter sp. GX 14042]